jgi:hypothetical protein
MKPRVCVSAWFRRVTAFPRTASVRRMAAALAACLLVAGLLLGGCDGDAAPAKVAAGGGQLGLRIMRERADTFQAVL